MNFYSIVLSAGKGTRMHSDKPKVIHELIDSPMVNLVLKELKKSNVDNNYLVVGYKKEEVMEVVNNEFNDIEFLVQEEQLGTGHAVKQAKPFLKNKEGITIITCGDTPLISSEIFSNLINHHIEKKSDLTVLSAEVENPYNYGRIIRNSHKNVEKIIEEADANDIQKQIKEINTGIYCVNNKLLFECIDEIENNNNQNEYYLTDIIDIFISKKYVVDAYKIKDEESTMGINDLIALEKASKIFQKRINYGHLKNGVKILDIDNTYIGANVQIGKGTIIYPNNYITGKSIIGDNNLLMPNNVLENITMGNNNQVGPFAYLRGNSELSDENRVGCFVELKNTHMHSGAKSAHLTYLGDSTIGEKTNIGCGVITANYDGVNKHKTVIGNNSFIGSNVNLIAPLDLGDGVFVAAGTTVTKDIDAEKFVISRSELKIKDKR